MVGEDGAIRFCHAAAAAFIAAALLFTPSPSTNAPSRMAGWAGGRGVAALIASPLHISRAPLSLSITIPPTTSPAFSSLMCASPHTMNGRVDARGLTRSLSLHCFAHAVSRLRCRHAHPFHLQFPSPSACRLCMCIWMCVRLLSRRGCDSDALRIPRSAVSVRVGISARVRCAVCSLCAHAHARPPTDGEHR